MQVSFFKNTWDTIPVAEVGVKSIFHRIKSGDKGIRETIELIRKLKKDENVQYKEEKKKLPAVTFSGTFGERLASSLRDYSGVLCVDMDDLQQEEIGRLKERFLSDDNICGFFVSPSGDGLKVLLYSYECSSEYHQHFYFSAEKYFKDTYGIDIDRACKDVSRLCYISYDSGAVLKDSFNNFPIDFDIRKEQFFLKKSFNEGRVITIDKNTELCFKVAKKWVERIFMFEEGQRNKYIHNLSCTLNRLGVPAESTVQLIDNNFITPDRKWLQSVGSAYKQNAAQFNTIGLREFSGDNSDPVPYIESPFKFGDVERDIRKVIIKFLDLKLPADVLRQVVETHVLVYRNFFDNGIVDEIGIKGISDHLIKEGIAEWRTNELNGITPLSSKNIFDIGSEIKDILEKPTEFMIGIEGLDEEIPGLCSRGNVLGVIGREGTYKSIVVHNFSYTNSVAGKNGLYCNGEMSNGQFIKRTVLIDSSVNFDYYLNQKEKIPDEIYSKAMLSIKDNIGDKLQVHTGKDFTKKSILDLVKKFRADGIDISYIVVDGLSQMADVKNDEIKSAIFNSGELKELAKEANVFILVLQHVRTGCPKTVRDTGEWARGGNKTTSNFDGYISTSLIEKQQMEDITDKEYHRGVFVVRFTDKRGCLDIVQKVVDIGKNIKLKVSNKELSDYEF